MAANDMKAAESTYSGFINLLKWSVPAIAAITLLIVIAISN